jgi:putative DNA primase/helicase
VADRQLDEGPAVIDASDVFGPLSRPMPAAVKTARRVIAGDVPRDELQGTDAALARAFALDHGDELQYDHRRKAWMLCDRVSKIWRPDPSGEAARTLQGWLETRCFERVAAALSKRDMAELQAESRRSLSARGLPNLLALASTQAGMATAGDDWDVDPWLLATAAGDLVDLRSGTVRPLAPVDRITRSAGVSVDPAARCDRFRRFLSEICNDERELVTLLAAALGYSVTGATTEQVFFMCLGSGSNGKTLLLEVVAYVLGDLAGSIPFNCLTRDRDIRAVQAELAELPGVRFARAAEVREGAYFDEGRIKSLTGGDTITVARKYGHPFPFRPTFKLWLSANSRPRVADRSHGLWRRVRLIPFERTFPGDQALERQLRDEGPGILGLLVEACLQWQAHGLPEHAGADRARAAWREAEDVIGQWAESSLVADDQARLPAAEAFRLFTAWADAEGVAPRERPGRRTFGEWLGARFTAGKSRAGKHYGARVVTGDGCTPPQGKVPYARVGEGSVNEPSYPSPVTGSSEA